MAYRGGVPPDRIDREIEEILSRMDEDEPISLEARRRRGRQRRPLGARAGAAFGTPAIVARITPTSLLFTGAGVMLAGIVLARAWDPLIWLAFAGVTLFIAAFAWALLRPRRAARASQRQTAKGAYWRGRYVEYDPAQPGVLRRIRRAFRRR